MNKKMLVCLSVLVTALLACNLSGVSTTPAPGGNGNQSNATPPADPISINEGLASLNSYQMTVIFKSTGPDPSQSSTTTVDMQRSRETKASYTHITMVSQKKGKDPTNTETNIYRIGNDECSGKTDDWSWTSMGPNQAEMFDITKSMLGLTPLITTPTFVAKETVNGIPSNHFSFKVSGLGVDSGAQVNINQGDYWLAVDGQYIVKYDLILETSLNPQTDVIHEEVSIDLSQVNQPITIAFPQGCLDASVPTAVP